MSVPKTIALIVILAGASAGIGTGIGKVIKYSMAPSKTVTCYECDHVVARPSATTKKKFKTFWGQDDKYELLYFCRQHPRGWDYAVECPAVWGQEIYFKSRYDSQVDKDGCEINNVSTRISGWHLSTDTNGFTTVVKEGTIGYVTNVGGAYQAKHLVP